MPSFLPDLPAGRRGNRLTLARWLVSRDNPLTARVTVNRQWAAIFGAGIVRTTGDFGSQGEPPTHPELLDWLAVRFMDDGWSIKRLTRLIVTSAAYRQSSRVTPRLREKDSENRLLARGPRVRLDAELIRDDVLRAAGLLSGKMYGPSVFPPQPLSVTTEGAYAALNWVPSRGEDRYRRSLYTFSRRSSPFAAYITFDAPSGEVCCPRRDLSNTPLQALTLMNSDLFVEPAQAAGRWLAADKRPVPRAHRRPVPPGTGAAAHRPGGRLAGEVLSPAARPLQIRQTGRQTACRQRSGQRQRACRSGGLDVDRAGSLQSR